MANRADVTAAYHRLTGLTMDAAAKSARDNFLNLGSWREDDIARYVSAVVPEIDNAKRTMANYAAGYYQKIAGVSEQKFRMPKITPDMISTQALRNGVTADVIWERPFKEMWTALSKGQDFGTALNAGAKRATSIARTEVQLARRGAGLYARNANDRIIGYIRTLSGSENCALCYVASTQRYNKGDLLPIHPGCDCGEMPIYGTTDVGQVIDEENLEKAHEAVAERFGFADRGARKIDYRKIAIHDHGELGPYLGVKGQKFTKLNPAKMNVPIKAPTPVPDSVKTTFAENIKPKLDKISGTTIMDDIRAEHGDVNIAALKGKAKIQTLGEKTTAHLDAIKRLGAEVDDEISKRVKKELNDLIDPIEVAATEKQIKLGEQLLEKAKLEYEAGIQQQISVQMARVDLEAQKRAKELLADGFTQPQVDDYLARVYSPEDRLRKAKFFAEDAFRKSPAGRKLRDEITDYERDLIEYRKTLPANIIPGSDKYNQIYAAKAKEVLAEVKDLGKGGPQFTYTTEQVANTVIEAKSVYPSDWLAKAAEVFPTIESSQDKRGGFSSAFRVLKIDGRRTAGFSGGYSTAVHELGHMFEYSVPGLKQLEFAFAHQRAALNPKRTKLSSSTRNPEVGFQDEWRNLYTGREYGFGVDDAYEIFTTGIESVFGGANMFLPETKIGIYINPSLGRNATQDDEFRQFILGVLFGL